MESVQEIIEFVRL